MNNYCRLALFYCQRSLLVAFGQKSKPDQSDQSKSIRSVGSFPLPKGVRASLSVSDSFQSICFASVLSSPISHTFGGFFSPRFPPFCLWRFVWSVPFDSFPSVAVDLSLSFSPNLLFGHGRPLSIIPSIPRPLFRTGVLVRKTSTPMNRNMLLAHFIATE